MKITTYMEKKLMKIMIFVMLVFTSSISIGDTNIKLPSNSLNNEIENEVIQQFKYQFDLIKSLHFSYKDNVYLVEVLLENTDEKNVKTAKERIETNIKEKKEIVRYKQVINNKKILTIIEFNKNTGGFDKIIEDIIPDSLKISSIEFIRADIIKEVYERIEIKK